jgi:hypothetical protein
MKKSLTLIAMVLVSLFAFAQSENPIKLIYEKDEFTGKEYLQVEPTLLVSEDGKKGFNLFPILRKEGDKWAYSTMGGVSTIGDCFENDKVFIIFEDGSKFSMTSWRAFNCKGDIGFDLYAKFRKELCKPMKAIRFQNARDYTTFEMTFTNQNDKNYFINVFKALDEYNATH